MRILHTGDLHYSGGLDGDIEISMSQITERAKSGEIDLITIGGDIYDGTSCINSRNTVKDRLKNIAQHCPIIIIYGNHDRIGDLEILADLKSVHPIKVCSIPTVINLDGGINIYAIPWIYKHHWLETHKIDNIPELNSTLSCQLLNYITSLRKLNPANQHIILTHILISGSRAENGQPLIGEGITLGEFDLEEAGFNAGFLSHIHLRQQFGNGRFFYPGSPASMDFGETTDKYYAVYDTQGGRVEWCKIDSVRRASIKGVWKDGQWCPDMTGCPELDLAGIRLKVEYDITPTDDSRLIMDSIRSYYAEDMLRELKLSPIVVNKMSARADNVSKAHSLENKLVEYWKHTEQQLPNAGSIIKKLKLAEGQCTTQRLPFKG